MNWVEVQEVDGVLDLEFELDTRERAGVQNDLAKINHTRTRFVYFDQYIGLVMGVLVGMRHDPVLEVSVDVAERHNDTAVWAAS